MKSRFFSYARAAQLLSGLCLLHCVSMPLVIALTPGLSAFISHELEIWITLSVVPIALAGFYPTWNRHKNLPIAFAFAVGLALMLLGSLVFGSHQTAHEQDTAVLQANVFGSVPLHTVFSVAGALLLSYTMYRNNRHVHSCHNPLHQH